MSITAMLVDVAFIFRISDIRYKNSISFGVKKWEHIFACVRLDFDVICNYYYLM